MFNNRWLMWVAIALMLTTLICLYCFKSLSRRVPINYSTFLISSFTNFIYYWNKYDGNLSLCIFNLKIILYKIGNKAYMLKLFSIFFKPKI